MSFGFVQDMESIKRAVYSSLSTRDVLFFAAAGNHGVHGNASVMAPARHDPVICIRATDSDGRFWSLNPPKRHSEGIRFGALGQDVLSASLGSEDGSHGHPIAGTGTSVATAVAAGIAGLLLWYVNMKTKEPSYWRVRNRLQSKDGMTSLLFALGRHMGDGRCFIVPWDLECDDETTRWAKFLATESS
jgi:hypothetical protein